MKHGQSLVEFALCLPFLLLILAGVFDLGRAMMMQVVLTNSAREGARIAMQSNRNPNIYQTEMQSIQNAVKGESNNALGINPSGVYCEWTEYMVGTTKHTRIKVTVTYEMFFILPTLLFNLPSISLHADATMQVE